MTTPLEYMQMATGVYAASDRNSINAPAGWTQIDWQPDTYTGFSAGVYKNDQTNEIVIAYTGTNDLIVDPLNWTAGLGLPLPQIFDAVRYYCTVATANPGANITFTGHSLGGGLASMMAVFFDKQATAFDEAPFQLAAMSPFVLPSVAATMDSQNYFDSSFGTYLLSGGLLALTREANVTQYYLEGEALSAIRSSPITLVGSDNPIQMGNSMAGVVERHSMSLLTALWKSPEFLRAAQKLPDLVSLLLDANLFATGSRDTVKTDLLRKLLRDELSITDSTQSDGMLSRFAADSLKLAQDGGLTLKDGSLVNPNAHYLSNALIAFAMQKYSDETAQSVGYKKELFTDLSAAGEGSGGIRFDMAAVSTKFKTAFDTNEGLTLSDAKGYEQYFKTYLQQSTFTDEERSAIASMLPNLRDWYVQAGAGNMTATDTQNRGAFMLGGAGDDALTGGTKADLLVGNAGNDSLNGGAGSDVLIGGMGTDTLDGGAGNDSLLGGAGTDSYQFSGKFGLDTVLDKDGQGSLNVAGTSPLNGGKNIADSVWESDDKQYRYTQVDGQLIVSLNTPTSGGLSGTILVKDWRAGQLNIEAANGESIYTRRIAA